MKVTKIAILAVNNCMASTAYGIADVFTAANYCARKLGEKSDPFETRIITDDGESVQSYNGLSIVPEGNLSLADDADIVILTPNMPSTAHTNMIDEYLQPIKHLIPWINELAVKGVCIASACTGSFFLAEAGLLDGKVATTHWRASQAFKDRYPSVILQSDELVTSDGNLLCSGGAVSYIDLSLHLVEKYTNSLLASKCAQMLVIDQGRDLQTPYNDFSFVEKHSDMEILKCQEWLEANYSKKVDVNELSSKLGMSTRNFNRRFKRACGKTPVEFLQMIRISAACDRLITGSLTIKQIVWNVGYEDVSSFGRLFKKSVGVTMEEYRKKFQNKR